MKNFYEEKKDVNSYNVFTDIVSLSKKETLSLHGQLAGVTREGLTVHSDKKFFLIPEKEFSRFLNQPVELFLSQYEIPFYGVLKKICPLEKDLFEIYIDFMENTPLYYRECVEDLLN